MSKSSVLHLQWIPSHLNLKYKDVTAKLAKDATPIPQINEDPLTCFNFYSKRMASIDITWRQPPLLTWYRSENPDIDIRSNCFDV
ncbi:RNase H domain-containing protein [Trichonephila clavata]|uniref:RNase H domain-containing protein n=1 Tax=Trichonephila clavata TaxID=2740835 RepID=A0A8X6FIX7_TRICU|nr:RNase H domain-containing protein [Trichonephila clavata]